MISQDSATVEIYGLHDPTTDELRYIGKAKCHKKRLVAHLREHRRHTPPYCWIRSLSAIPVVRVLSVVLEAQWELEEKRLIFEARLSGTRLLNLADGGDQPKSSPEQLQRCARTMNARKAQYDDKTRAIYQLKEAFSH